MKYILTFLFAINSLSGQTLKPFNNSYTQDYALLIQVRITPKLSIKDLIEIPKSYEDVNAVQIYVEKLLGEAQKIEVKIDSILGSSTIHLSYPEFQLTYSNLGFDRMTSQPLLVL
jgi:hypothetical protein